MKRIALFTVTAILIGGCSKQNALPVNTSSAVRASIVYSGSPAMDRYGWILKITADSFEIPGNLPAEYQQDNLLVDVSFKKSDKVYQCRCTVKRNMVDIISISRVSSATPK